MKVGMGGVMGTDKGSNRGNGQADGYQLDHMYSIQRGFDGKWVIPAKGLTHT